MSGRDAEPTVTATRWLVDRQLLGIVQLDESGIVVGCRGGLVGWVDVGQRCTDCMPFLSGFEDALIAVARQKQAPLFLSGIHHPTDADGAERLISVHCFPTEGSSGTTLVFQDTTAVDGSGDSAEQQRSELALAERRMTQAQERAKVANEARSLFLANVSHELRTPLNVIIGNAEILRDCDPGTFPAEDLHTFAEDILDNGTFLLDHINDLLDLARAEVGGIDLDEEEIDIGLIVDGAMAAASKLPNAGTLTIEHSPATPLPLLLGDPNRLRQILINLLVDAVRITPKGGSVRIRTFVADDNALTVEIAGDRSPTTAASPDGVEQPFGMADVRPGDVARSDSALGLPLAKTLIELHDGTLTLDGAPGETTRLTLRFPPKRTQAAT